MSDKRRYRNNSWRKRDAVRRIEFGNRIAMYRVKAGYSQDELGKKVGLGRTSIVNIESGRQIPPVTLLPEFVRHLKITYNKLLKDLGK
jgi:DNA-binding XRE family transcriptional regulator